MIPLGTVTLTIGVDSQSDGFYFLLACWGRKMEVWLPLTGRITGDMRADAVWKALLEVLTPEGVVRTEDLQPAQARSLQRATGRILDFIIIGVSRVKVPALLIWGKQDSTGAFNRRAASSTI